MKVSFFLQWVKKSFLLLVFSCGLSVHSTTKSMDCYDNDHNTHPLTQDCLKSIGISERLKLINIGEIKQDIENSKSNCIDIEKYAHSLEALKCPETPQGEPKVLVSTHCSNLWPSISTQELRKKEINNGCSGATVCVLYDNNENNIIAIKKLNNNTNESIKELLYSLLCLSINPSPKEIKMVRIFDAIIFPNNSLNLIMEGANTGDIHNFLSSHFLSNQQLVTDVITACALYLAKFHHEMHKKSIGSINQEQGGAFEERLEKYFLKYKHNASYSIDSCDQLVCKEALLSCRESHKNCVSRDSIPKKRSCYITQEIFSQQEGIFESLKSSFNEAINGFKKYNNFMSKSNNLKNPKKRIRDLLKNQKPYFFTVTHGDAHGKNLFYNNENIDLSSRITMIDFQTIHKTYGGVGDPAEDVGRFLGSLWDWAAQNCGNSSNRDDYFERMFKFQETFLKTYEGNNKLEPKYLNLFKCSHKFYKLRYYKAISSDLGQDKHYLSEEKNEENKEILRNIFYFWMKESSKENPILGDLSK